MEIKIEYVHVIFSTAVGPNSERNKSILIPEVVCHILPYLPCKDLISATSTCKAWYESGQKEHVWQVIVHDTTKQQRVKEKVKLASPSLIPKEQDLSLLYSEFFKSTPSKVVFVKQFLKTQRVKRDTSEEYELLSLQHGYSNVVFNLYEKFNMNGGIFQIALFPFAVRLSLTHIIIVDT